MRNSQIRSQKDIDKEQTCLTCPLPECIDRRYGCPYQKKYGAANSVVLRQETVGYPVTPDIEYKPRGLSVCKEHKKSGTESLP